MAEFYAILREGEVVKYDLMGSPNQTPKDIENYTMKCLVNSYVKIVGEQ